MARASDGPASSADLGWRSKDDQTRKAYDQIIRETNTAKLNEIARQSELDFQQNKARAIALAKEKGWVIRTFLPDSSVIELMGVDEKGHPIYYITQSNFNAGRTIRTDQVWSGGSMGLALGGNGMIAGEWDAGRCRPTHNEFQTGAGTRVINGDGAGNDSHATHVGGTIIAKGNDNQARGMANEAFLKSFNWGSDESEMATEGANGLLVSNHSYGQLAGWSGCDWYGDLNISTTLDYTFGLYTGSTAQWDQIAVDAPYYLICKAAGNDRGNNCGGAWRAFVGGAWVTDPPGYTRPPADGQYDCISTYGNAKNIMTVAAVNIQTNYVNAGSVTMSGFSSWGPTDDGRIKPDISAAGVGLYSTEVTNDNAYSTKSGTSMATPTVTGSSLLIQEHHKNVTGSFMRSATLKGLIIHTADECGANPGPDYAYGWGLMNTGRAVQHITDNNLTSIIRENTLNQGETYTLQVYSDGSQPLRATICWTDPAGTPNAPVLNDRTPRLVNDLDLRITGGTTVMPWMLDPNNPSASATRGDNIRDNVEQVLISTPSAGYYTITVTHKGTLQGSSQRFALIVSTVNCFAEINPISQTIYCAGQTATLTTPNIAGVTYQWTRNGVDLGGETGTTLNATLSGTYRLRTTRGACVALSQPVVLTFNPVTVAGTLASNQTVCAGTNVSMSLSGQTGNVLRWESSTDNFTTVTTINQTTPNLTVNAISTTTKYRTVVQSPACNILTSNEVQITVTGFAGTTSSDATVCADNHAGTITLTGNTGAVLHWESSTDNFTTINIIPFTGNILTYTNLPTDTRFRAVIDNTPCPPASSSATLISTIPQPNISVSASPTSPVCDVPSSVTLTSVYTPAPPFDDCTRYTLQTVPFAPYPHAGTNVFGSAVDDAVSSAITLGFNFDFYCNTFNAFKVSSNGFLSFDNSFVHGCCNGGLIPTNDGINNLISAVWTDNQLSSADDVKYQVLGTAPNRIGVLSFGNTYKYYGGANIRAQVVLYETSNIIDIIAINIPASSYTRTMGIENANGTIGIAPPGRNRSNTWSDANTTYRFIPFTSPANFSYTWSNISNGFTANAPNATDNSPVMGSSTYRLTVSHAGTGCSKTYNLPYQVDAPTVAGTLTANATVCQGSNSGTLTLTGFVGNILRWESSTNNFATVNIIPNTTPTQNYTNLLQTTQYRAVVQSGVCLALTSNSVQITVDSATNAGILSMNATVCAAANSGTMILAGSVGSILRWESSTDNFATVNIIPNTTPTQNYTNLLQTTQYRAVVKSGVCATLTSNSIQVTVDPVTVAGTLSSNATVCASGNSGTLTLTSFTDNILHWESSTDNFTTVTIIPNTTPTQNYTNLLQTTQYRAVVKSGVCATLTSNAIQITVDSVTVAGTLSSNATVCAAANSGTMILAGSVGSILRWESSTDNFATVNIIPNTTPTQNYTNLLQTTQYRAVVKSGVCATLTSNAIQITVDSVTVAGTLSSNATVCASGNSGTLTLTGFTGNIIRWESSTDNFTTVTIIPNTTPTQNYTNLLQTTQYRAVVKSGVCATLTSNSIQVTVDPATVAGTLSSNATVCASGNSGTLTLTGFMGNIIRWESSTDSWTTVTTINNLTPSLTYTNLVQTTEYRAVVQSGICNLLATNHVRIQVDPITVAGTLSSDQTVCASGNSGSITLTGQTGSILRWESSTDNWATVSTITNTFVTQTFTNLAQTTTYRAVVQSGTCNQTVTNAVTITVDAPTMAGMLTSPVNSVCMPIHSSAIQLNGHQGNILRWESSTDNWASVTTINNNTNLQPFSNLVQTTAYRAVVQSGLCPVLMTAPLTITVYPATIAGTLSSDATVCAEGNSGTLTLTGSVGSILRWESSTDNWATVTTIPNFINQYIYNNLTQNTAYRAVVQSGICNQLVTNTVQISVDAPTVAGALLNNMTVCGNLNAGMLVLNGFSGNILRWESSTDNWATVTTINNTTPNHAFNNLTQTTAYRAVVQSGVCEAKNSNPVTVQVDAPTIAGTLSSDATVCQSGNTGTLTLTGQTGSIVRWESSTDGFTTFSIINHTASTYNFTNLTQTTAFRVVVKSGVCAVIVSNAVRVQVDLPTIAGALSADQTVCGENPTGTLQVSGHQGNVIRWESSTDNWTTVSTINHTQAQYTFTNVFSNTQFRAVVQSGICNPSVTNVVRIQVDPATVGGTLGMPLTVCGGDNSGMLTLTGYQGNIIRWEMSEFAFISGIVSISNTAPNQTFTNLSRNTWYRAVVKSGICAEKFSEPVLISTTLPPLGGTISGSRTVCANSQGGTLTLRGQRGVVMRWESSTDNWTTINILNGSGTSYTYSGLTQTTQFRVMVGGVVNCSPVFSTEAIITVVPATVAGMLTGDASVCAGNNTGLITLNGNVGQIVSWQRSIDNGQSWQNVSGGNPYRYTNLARTTWYRAVVRNNPCTPETTHFARITVFPVANAGTISANRTFCSSQNSGSIILSGNQGTLVRWESSTDNWVTMSTLPPNGPTLNYLNLTQTIRYRAVIMAQNCGEVRTNVVTITVNSTLNGGILAQDQTICTGQTAMLSLTGQQGQIQRWERSDDNWQTIFPIANTTSNLLATNLPRTSAFRVKIGNGNCPAIYSNAVTVTLRNAPITGTISGMATVCSGKNSGTVNLSGYEGNIVRWESSTDNWETVTTLMNNAPSHLYQNLSQTTQFRAVVANDPFCGTVNTNSVTVRVVPQTVPGTLLGNDFTCIGSPITLQVSGYTGQIVRWEKSIDNWQTVQTINNSTDSYTFDNLTQTTAVRVIVQNGICPPETTNVKTIQLQESLQGGVVSLVTGSGNNCANPVGYLQLSGYTGNIRYWEYSNDNFTSIQTLAHTADTLNFNRLPMTAYYRAVLVGNGCNPVRSVAVQFISAFRLQVSAVTGCGALGYATATASGGLPPYRYILSPVSGGQSMPGVFTGLRAGNYILMALDSRNCIAQTSFTIQSITPAPLITAAGSNSPTNGRIVWTETPPGNPNVSYEVRFRPVGHPNWTTITVTQGTELRVDTLQSTVTYETQVRAQCHQFSSFTAWSWIQTFTTLSIKDDAFIPPNPVISIYPNPASDVLYLNGSYRTLRVYDSGGKMVWAIDHSQEVISVKGWTSGIYYLIFTTNEGKNLTHKVIIE